MRITKSHVRARVMTLNKMLGVEPGSVGSIEVGSAYGGYRIEQICNEARGVRDLSNFGYGTAREAYYFVAGMIAALEVTQ